MKKFCLLILFALAACSGIQAQRPVGDTLWPPVDTDYFYLKHLDWFFTLEHTEGYDTNWYIVKSDPMLNIFQSLSHGNAYCDGNYIAGQQYYTGEPIKVIGIALCVYMQQPSDTTISLWMSEYNSHMRNPGLTSHLFFPNTNDTSMKGRITDSAILYRPRITADGLDMEKLAAAEWRMEQPHRYIYLPPLDSLAFFYSHGEDDIIAPLYEVLFDSAVVLDDTFVVASTAFNNEGSTYSRTVMGHTENIWLWDHPATRFYNIERWHNPEGIDSTDISWIKFRQLEWTGGVRCHDSVSSASYDSCGTWERHVMRCGCRTWAYPFFPIIELGFDTTLCHEVSNLRVAERGAGCATLMWDAGDGGPWVVAYGKITDAWEDFTFDTVTSPMLTLTGLEVGTQYFALVRGYCSVTGEYGEWTNPLEVEIYHPGSGSEPEGIDRPGDLGRFTRLMPNPAREQVSVLSSYKMSRIEVYALDGRKVLEQEVGGISTVMEVKDLPRGTYIMAVYLPHGVATKKLVLE